MNHHSIQLGLIQSRCTDNREHNLNGLLKCIEQAAADGANLVVLPELHSTPYFCQTENPDHCDLAEPLMGPTTQRLAEIAGRLGVVIVGSIFERRAAGLYHNTAVVLDSDGTLAGIYRKMHIPDDPGYSEKFYFTPGEQGFVPIATSLGKLGVLVCWDQWFPEAARLMALAGAEILLYPTAIGWEPADSDEQKRRQLDAWMIIQQSHAIANGIPVAAVNRTGFEPAAPSSDKGIQFWGSSFVTGPQGEIIEQATADREQNLVVEIDLQASEQVRRIWPYLRDRRIDAYGDLTLRYRDTVVPGTTGTSIKD